MFLLILVIARALLQERKSELTIVLVLIILLIIILFLIIIMYSSLHFFKKTLKTINQKDPHTALLKEGSQALYYQYYYSLHHFARAHHCFPHLVSHPADQQDEY